jgi:hypothetical protein
LFQLDSSLNSDQIKWNLVLQTGCETGKEAQKYFHGIIIYFETQQEQIIETPVVLPEIPKREPEPSINDTMVEKNNYIPVPEPEIDMLYPIKDPGKKHKQKKQEPIKLPDCPDFRKKMFWQ